MADGLRHTHLFVSLTVSRIRQKPEKIQSNLQIMRIVQLWQRHTLSAELEPVKPDFRLTLLNKHL